MTSIACPVCAGPVDLDVDKPTCLIGHDFEANELQLTTQRAADRALWTAIRALEDATSAAQWILTRPEASERKPYLRDHIVNGQQAANILRALVHSREGSESDTEHRPEDW